MKILVVDDDTFSNDTLSDLLSQSGHEVACATRTFEANQQLESFDPDVVLLDLWMPEMTGISYLQEIRAIRPLVNVLLITGLPIPVMVDQARAQGVAVILKKPLDLDRLEAALEDCESGAS